MERNQDTFSDFVETEFTHDGKTLPVYVGGKGPAVIVIHEVPGLYPEVVDFGRKVIAEGFTVYMPSLIGKPGKNVSIPYTLQTFRKVCISREFSIFSAGKNSPVTIWLRALARHAHEQCGGPGVGVVGMCLTGGFALAMMLEECVLAPVLSQPSLPVAITKKQRQDLGIDEATLERVKQRVAQGVCLMGLRFSSDPLVPTERFDRLREELGDGFIAVEIDSSIGNKHKVPPLAHSVLVYNYDDTQGHPTRTALGMVMKFYRERLLKEYEVSD